MEDILAQSNLLLWAPPVLVTETWRVGWRISLLMVILPLVLDRGVAVTDRTLRTSGYATGIIIP